MLGKSEGIVLRTQDYGEGNKIITVFTRDMGKIGLMARGARKTKSVLAAVSQPFIQAHFIFHPGSGLSTLSHGEIVHSFPKIRGDLYRTAYAAYLLELTDRLTEDRQRVVSLYDILLESLKQMEAGKDYEIVARIFEIKILSMFGFKPVVNHCAVCHEGVAPWFFSIREGGLLCGGCRSRDPYAFLLGEGLPRLLYTFQTMDIAKLGQINVKEQTRQQLQKIMGQFIDEYVGIPFKSRKFIDQLAAMEQALSRRENPNGEKGEPGKDRSAD